jgi:succinoglycan biosynthesis transport protein ExoP
MDLRAYLTIVRRRWLTVAIVFFSCFAAAGALTLLTTPRYTATTELFFGVQGTGSAAELAQGSTFSVQQMTSYARVATSPLVMDPVIQQLGLGVSPAVLAKQVSASVPAETVILELSVTDANPEQAARIANALGSTLAEAAVALTPDRADGSQAVRATTLAAAAVPLSQTSPNVMRNIALGLAVGILLAFGLSLLRDLLDTKLRSPADIRALTDTPILGVIGFSEDVPRHPVILRGDSHSAAAEAVRRLRTNLQFVDVAEQCRSIVISSSVPGEGKTTTAINLAVALADSGSHVLLVDADLRRPSVADSLGLEGGAGLTTVLIGRADVEDVVQPWGDSTLDVLAAGQVPPNPSELLGSTAMLTLIRRLTGSYDTVIIDSPPLLPVTDAAVLGRQSGGVLLVAGVDRIHRSQLGEALESLETAGVPILGLVVNKIARREVASYAYERYYPSKAEQGVGGDLDTPATTNAPRTQGGEGNSAHRDELAYPEARRATLLADHLPDALPVKKEAPEPPVDVVVAARSGDRWL